MRDKIHIHGARARLDTFLYIESACAGGKNLGERVRRCPKYGFVIERDLDSARNILNRMQENNEN